MQQMLEVEHESYQPSYHSTKDWWITDGWLMEEWLGKSRHDWKPKSPPTSHVCLAKGVAGWGRLGGGWGWEGQVELVPLLQPQWGKEGRKIVAGSRALAKDDIWPETSLHFELNRVSTNKRSDSPFLFHVYFNHCMFTLCLWCLIVTICLFDERPFLLQTGVCEDHPK